MEQIRGQLLVAAKHLLDPNFFKTVVLMIEQSESGAMGVVINRPSDIAVSHALSGHLDVHGMNENIFYGGPVEPGGLIVLHDRADLAESEAVIPGVYVPTRADVFEEVIRAAQEDGDSTIFRVYNGCAGWSPGQLESEIARGDWYSIPASADLVFCDDPYSVWEESMNQVATSQRFIDQTVENPELN
ncbi:MAG: YqgE/AlgH family protein [Planctomycetaceae bacterium]|nr:YqgE/AlgH family protein [Planctomycetaceae bacterium]